MQIDKILGDIKEVIYETLEDATNPLDGSAEAGMISETNGEIASESTNKIKTLLHQLETEVRADEEKRIKSIMDGEFYRIQFVGYPYAGIQIKDLMQLKRAFFDTSKKGDAIRKTLSDLSKVQARKTSQKDNHENK